MGTFLASVVCESLTIQADSVDEAEAKYDAFFNNEPCPCNQQDCKCVKHDDSDVRHYMEDISEDSQVGVGQS